MQPKALSLLVSYGTEITATTSRYYGIPTMFELPSYCKNYTMLESSEE
jgi:hypothetical protein